mmetsp:Transcript_58168/g.147543  ORF Transcript_58168/g.147543 Transcript_58168/m.147543 type:complete len:206 (-) Transcript_58168:696-1313(-)
MKTGKGKGLLCALCSRPSCSHVASQLAINSTGPRKVALKSGSFPGGCPEVWFLSGNTKSSLLSKMSSELFGSGAVLIASMKGACANWPLHWYTPASIFACMVLLLWNPRLSPFTSAYLVLILNFDRFPFPEQPMPPGRFFSAPSACASGGAGSVMVRAMRPSCTGSSLRSTCKLWPKSSFPPPLPPPLPPKAFKPSGRAPSFSPR